MNKQYSEWLRVDLHIHTDWSKKTKHNDYKGLFSVDTLHAKLTQNKVEVFSLTDHNIVNIDAYNEYYEKYNQDTDPLLLVGTELDIIVESGTRKTYHTLIIFNYSSAEKAQYVYEKLETKYSNKGIDPFQRTLTIDEVIELFPNDEFFFIPHAGGQDKSIIKPYREDIETAQRMIILMHSAMEKVPEQSRQHYNQMFNKVYADDFKNREDLAYIEFSDNHSIETYPISEPSERGVEHSFYYIKGGKSFETIRQAFIDPKSRIKSSAQYNSIHSSQRYIESIELEAHGIIQGQNISFSPHLNVLIGGRSTGKSLLLTALVGTIDSIQHRAKKDYPTDSDRIKIKAIQDSTPTNQTSIDAKRLTYIGQGEIVNYFEKGNLSELASSTGTNDFYSESKQAFSAHRLDLNSSTDDLVSRYSQCEHLGNEKYILHESTLDSLLGDSFTFTWKEEEVLSSNDYSEAFEEANETITVLIDYIARLKSHSIISLSDADNTLIQSFEEMVESKRSALAKTEANKSKALNFLQKVAQIIAEKNDALDDGARQKTSARTELRDLQSRVKQRFQDLDRLKEATTDTASFNYSMRQDVELHEGIKLVLEVENIPDSSVKDLIVEGIKNAQPEKSLYSVLLGLLHGSVTVKNFGDGSSASLRPESVR